MDPMIDNYIDENIKSMIMPFHMLQSLLLLPKFKIHNNIISFNRFIYYFISSSFIVLCSYVFVVGSNIIQTNVDQKFTYYLIALIQYVTSYATLLMIFFLNIYNKKYHIEIVLYMQKVLKFEKILKNEKCSNSFIRRSVHIKLGILLLSYLAIIIVGFKTFVMESVLIHIYFTVSFLFHLYHDINLLENAEIINFIKQHLVVWMNDINYYSKDNIRSSTSQGRTIKESELIFIQRYKCIFETYNMCKRVYQGYVSMEIYLY